MNPPPLKKIFPFKFQKNFINLISGSLALRISILILQLLLALIVAKILGVKEFGRYSFFISIIQFLTMPVMMGGQQLLVREIAYYTSAGKISLIKGLLLRYFQTILLLSLILGIAIEILLIFCLDTDEIKKHFLIINISLLIIPFLSLMQLEGAILRGFKKILTGQIATALRPAMIISCIVGIRLTFDDNFYAITVLKIQLIVAILLCIYYAIIIFKILPKKTLIVAPEFETSRWFKGALPLLLIGAMQLVNNEISIILLGIMENLESVGLYRVAQRGAALISFGLLAINITIEPSIAEEFSKGYIERLQKKINKSVLIACILATPVSFGLILGGKYLLALIFGIDYVAAYPILVILSIGQLVNVIMGPVALVLNMIGKETYTAKGVVIGAITNLLLNSTLIPLFGLTGAAISTTISVILWNYLLSKWLYQQCGLTCFMNIKNYLFSK